MTGEAIAKVEGRDAGLIVVAVAPFTPALPCRALDAMDALLTAEGRALCLSADEGLRTSSEGVDADEQLTRDAVIMSACGGVSSREGDGDAVAVCVTLSREGGVMGGEEDSLSGCTMDVGIVDIVVVH